MAFYVLFIVLYKYALCSDWGNCLSFVNLFKMPYKALVFVKNKICKKILSIFVHVFILLYVKSRNRNWLWMIENQCVIVCMEDEKSINLLVRDRHFTCKNKESFDN